ncbi:MAG TPA: GntR family transcriptional regulator [Bordetella sp.]
MDIQESTKADLDDNDAPLADVVYQHLLDAIYQGQLPPGSVVNELALAQEFGISRGPVREAVRRLQGIQLITRQPYAKSRVISLSTESAIELFELRMALEGMACSLATRRMNDVDIEQLLHELESHHHPRSDPTPKVFDFHERIVRACGNTRIINALCGDLYHLLRIYRRHSTSVVIERKEDAYEEHWQILHAMKARNAALAESLMRSHIGRATDNLAKQLSTSSLSR